MAKFELSNLEIKTVGDGRRNAGNPYMVGKMINTLAPLDKTVTFTEFDPAKIDLYRDYVAKSKGGNAEDGNIPAIPDRLKYVNGHYATWAPPKECIPFQKHYVTAGEHTVNGTVISHKEGDTIVDKRGNPRLYDSIVVFCKYYMDPDFPGIPQYLQGNHPTQMGQTYFDSFCDRIGTTTATTSIDEEEVGAIPTQLETPADKKIIGYNPETGKPIYG